MLCSATKPNLPGGSTPRRPDPPRARTAPGTARLWHRRRPVDERVRGCRRPPRRARRRRPGTPSATISGLRSTRADVGFGARDLAEADEHVDQPARGRPPARRGTGRAAPGCRRSSIISSASIRVDGHQPERHVGERLGEDPADAEHHARPELRVRSTPAISSRLPAPSARRAGRRRRRPAVARPAARWRPPRRPPRRPSPSRTRPRSVLWAMVAAQLDHHGERDPGGGGRRALRGLRQLFAPDGNAEAGQQPLGFRLRQAGHGRHRRSASPRGRASAPTSRAAPMAAFIPFHRFLICAEL